RKEGSLCDRTGASQRRRKGARRGWQRRVGSAESGAPRERGDTEGRWRWIRRIEEEEMLFEYRIEAAAPRLVENRTVQVSIPAVVLHFTLLLLLLILQSEE